MTAPSADIGLGKFVIPNPFGPYEEPEYLPVISSRTGWPAPHRIAPVPPTFETISTFPYSQKYTLASPRMSQPKASARSIPAAMRRAKLPLHFALLKKYASPVGDSRAPLNCGNRLTSRNDVSGSILIPRT